MNWARLLFRFCARTIESATPPSRVRFHVGLRQQTDPTLPRDCISWGTGHSILSATDRRLIARTKQDEIGERRVALRSQCEVSFAAFA